MGMKMKNGYENEARIGKNISVYQDIFTVSLFH